MFGSSFHQLGPSELPWGTAIPPRLFTSVVRGFMSVLCRAASAAASGQIDHLTAVGHFTRRRHK